jgi:putative hemolysin
MRMRCYALSAASAPVQTARPMEPVAEPHDPHRVVRSLLSLPDECLLLREGDYAIYTVRASQSSLLMEELGYLREFTFRLVGEGSGKARDLDIYDEQYHHLLLWNEKDRCLAGAYRLGKVQEILAEKGEEGLYTASLFRITKEFFRRYSDALELGRAVIHPQYQREYSPLMLLWKGIGQFLLRHDEIHCLFGPVSLSLDYTPASLRTVVEYLQEQCGSTELSSMVRGRRLPDRLLRASAGTPLPDIMGYNVLVALVRDIEGGRGLPILFKHYLKLGGKIGAFHLDTAFNTLDAFLLMDLVDSPRGMLERYMTPEGAARFLARWKGAEGSPPSPSAGWRRPAF